MKLRSRPEKLNGRVSIGFDTVTNLVSETNGTLILSIVRAGATNTAVTVDYFTTNGTALAGSDFLATNGSLTFAPGIATNTITVPLTNDDTQENNELFRVRLLNPTNTVLALGTNAVTIADDDSSTIGFTFAALSVPTVWLARRENPFAYLYGIALITSGAWALGYVTPPASWFSAPDFSSVFLKLDVWGALRLSLLPAIITVILTDLFDSLSTFIGVAQAANLVDEHGQPKNLRQGLIVDSFATFGAALFGSSSGTAYVESIAGIRMGGRTGLTAVVTAFLAASSHDTLLVPITSVTRYTPSAADFFAMLVPPRVMSGKWAMPWTGS